MNKEMKMLIKEAILEALVEFTTGGVAMTSEGEGPVGEGESNGSTSGSTSGSNSGNNSGSTKPGSESSSGGGSNNGKPKPDVGVGVFSRK